MLTFILNKPFFQFFIQTLYLINILNNKNFQFRVLVRKKAKIVMHMYAIFIILL